jgi:N-acetylmuramoyl-L-alanine amidase
MATGKEIVNAALKHVGEQYILGTLVPKNDPAWDGPWDCAEFVSWCIYHTAKILYGCEDDQGDPATADAYTGFWGRDARTIGKLISVATAARIPGAAVLRLGPKMGHVVISDGRGGTVEAASTKAGVICHTLSGRRWDLGILVPGISYEEGNGVQEPAAPGVVYRLTSPLMSGEKIEQIQQKLASLGFDPGGADGIFGHQTFAAVMDFQKSNGLVPDGEVGLQTAKAMGITLP